MSSSSSPSSSMSCACVWSIRIPQDAEHAGNKSESIAAWIDASLHVHGAGTSAACFLSFDDRQAIRRFVRPMDRMRAWCSRWLVRQFIHACTGIALSDVDVRRDAHGKPYFGVPPTAFNLPLPRLAFNVSHHGAWVVLAGVCSIDPTNSPSLAPPSPPVPPLPLIGCDVTCVELPARCERTDRGVLDYLSSFESSFTRDEWSRIVSSVHGESSAASSGSSSSSNVALDSHVLGREAVRRKLGVSIRAYDALSTFASLWAHKEAVVKALGTGLSTPLQSFELRPHPHNAQMHMHALSHTLNGTQAARSALAAQLPLFLPRLNLVDLATGASASSTSTASSVPRLADCAWELDHFALDDQHRLVTCVGRPRPNATQADSVAPADVEHRVEAIRTRLQNHLGLHHRPSVPPFDVFSIIDLFDLCSDPNLFGQQALVDFARVCRDGPDGQRALDDSEWADAI